MTLRAEAFKQYNEAAILDKLLSSMPAVMANISKPLSQVDRITIVSTGNGQNGMGANQITGDITRIIAQFPALVETLTGVKLSDLMSRVARLDNGSGSARPGTPGEAPAAGPVAAVAPPAPRQTGDGRK